jgi:hypothetical protein
MRRLENDVYFSISYIDKKKSTFSMAAIPTCPTLLLYQKYVHSLGSEQFCDPEKVNTSNLAVADANFY